MFKKGDIVKRIKDVKYFEEDCHTRRNISNTEIKDNKWIVDDIIND